MADVDRQDRGCILVEDHPVAADAEAVTIAALKRLYAALAGHRVAVELGHHLITRISGKGIKVFRRAQRKDDRFHQR